MSLCKALTVPNTEWSFCPNIGAAYGFAVLFALTTIVHIAQAIIYKKAYCCVIVFSGLAQFICYIFRILSIANPGSFSDYAAWFVLILVAPLFTNAFVYMTVGRMVWNYVEDAKIFGVTASRFGLYFVILDIVAFIVQVGGAATAVGENVSVEHVLRSLHIYMGGVGLQECFILIFLIFAFKLHATVLAQARSTTTSQDFRQVLLLLYTLYATLVLISIRIIFRLVEYSQGLQSTIPNHEVYQYCLDTLPMLIALVLLNVVHPGRIMRGKECDIPSRKERKLINRKIKEEHSPQDTPMS